MQLPAKQLTWVTGSSGSNPDLSVIERVLPPFWIFFKEGGTPLTIIKILKSGGISPSPPYLPKQIRRGGPFNVLEFFIFPPTLPPQKKLDKL